MPVLTRKPEARGPVSVFVLPSKFRSPAYNYELKTIRRFDDFTCSQRTSSQTWSGQNLWKLCLW